MVVVFRVLGIVVVVVVVVDEDDADSFGESDPFLLGRIDFEFLPENSDLAADVSHLPLEGPVRTGLSVSEG